MFIYDIEKLKNKEYRAYILTDGKKIYDTKFFTVDELKTQRLEEHSCIFWMLCDHNDIDYFRIKDKIDIYGWTLDNNKGFFNFMTSIFDKNTIIDIKNEFTQLFGIKDDNWVLEDLCFEDDIPNMDDTGYNGGCHIGKYVDDTKSLEILVDEIKTELSEAHIPKILKDTLLNIMNTEHPKHIEIRYNY